MQKYKTISIEPDTFEAFSRMADSYKLTNKGLVEAMLLYFQATKADPRDPKADNPTDAIKALDKRLISFIKEQEKKTLNPIKEALFDLASSEGATRKHELRIVNANVKKIITHLKIDS
ncbi:BfmA/BtgA family mobilization protein [Spirosoma pollinicola]|uniref:Uncharacterized protein n=1 Tax=Spirosoma pollinicola TaxID=2057025 RepID=A0A2K8ZB46_9BACT|nr:BfmA/BtgA family mobilization protein [Spirosoma pollinicola]AUD07088.1 hypothetical protein CWM47_37885 [Spirosoma pollinicola]